MYSLSCDAGEYRRVYLKRRTCEALGLQMFVVQKWLLMTILNMGKILKKMKSAVSLLHYASVTCCQFSAGENRLMKAQFSTALKLCLDCRLSHLIRAWSFLVIGSFILSVNGCVTRMPPKQPPVSPISRVKLLLSVTLSGRWVMSSSNETLLLVFPFYFLFENNFDRWQIVLEPFSLFASCHLSGTFVPFQHPKWFS